MPWASRMPSLDMMNRREWGLTESWRTTMSVPAQANAATETTLFYVWGMNGDIPVPGDFDGDRTTDIAVFRPSTGVWQILYSSNGTSAFQQWGLTGDIPVLRRQ